MQHRALATLVVTLALFARAAEPDKAQVVNIGSFSSAQRKDNRPRDLWRWYMHGVVDHFATPVPWEDLLPADSPAARRLVKNRPIDTPYKKVTGTAVRCPGSTRVDFPKPLPIDMAQARGKRIRLFVWLEGVDAGARNNCWHGPDMRVTIRDAKGRPLASREGYFQTQRTYPYHCYYTETFVPKQAAGVHVAVYNKFCGVAYFSALSWEFVGKANTYSNDEKQDPETGSLAFNPLYQEMPYHLKWGHGYRYPWRFVLGKDAGLVGQPYNITTHEGFRRYYVEEAKTEPEHMNHAILYMQQMYRVGTAKKMLPPLEPGWLENFARILIDDQDPETGYWHDGTDLSLGLTFHLCDMHFRYLGVTHRDRPPRTYLGQDLGLKRVPRADRIIRTTLRQQSSYVDKAGIRRRAAWNTKAYRFTTEPDKYAEKCYLATTWDAIYLLQLAANYVDDAGKAEVYEAIKASFRYVLRFNVLENGVYKQHDTDKHPTNGNYMGGIMQDSNWLDRKLLPDLPPPSAKVTQTGAAATVTWATPGAEQNSLRIYGAPPGTLGKDLNATHLVGIIHRTGKRVWEMDPFLAVQHIRRAASERWGSGMNLPSADHWRGKKYLPWKLRQIAYDAKWSLPHTNNAQPLRLPRAPGIALYVSTANWYGEESVPVPVAVDGGN